MAGRETTEGAPAGPQVIPLPHPPSTAFVGGHSIGHGSSDNVVSEQREYIDFARTVSEADNNAGQITYNTSNDIQNMTNTTFVMPSATPRILNFSADIKGSLASFRAVTEEMTSSARNFAAEIVGVG